MNESFPSPLWQGYRIWRGRVRQTSGTPLFLLRKAGEGDHAKHGGGGFLNIAP
jgi:hypothetical protein